MSKARMPETMRNRGICTTCNHVGACTLRSNQDLPILHCEEFECDGRLVSSGVRRSRDRAASTLDQKQIGASVHLGLCINCEHRDTCTFTKPEGGVWRCNEYC
jgi:hypothetical protein